MSLRKKNKDHIRESAFGPQAVAAEVTDYTSTPLQFWTKHEHKPVFIDLSVFETGEISRKVRGGQWGGPFSGRPELIHQLAPAIKEHLQFSPKSSATSFVKHLRQWWRLFDEIESRTKEVGLPLIRISSVKDFTELHRQAAMDAGISPQSFHALRRVTNITRRALGLRELHWVGPEQAKPKRLLPPPEKIQRIWNALKRKWLTSLDRWRRAEQLLQGQLPAGEIEERLRRNYVRFKAVENRMKSSGKLFPKITNLRQGLDKNQCAEYSTTIMYEGFYPNANEARIAFHLSLAGCGWNAQPLLDLKVDVSNEAPTRTPFLQPHPSDPTRYVMRGYKTRGKSEPLDSGHWKTDRSPGVIVLEMVTRTWPLRLQLRQELKSAIEEHRVALEGFALLKTTNTLQKRINKLKRIIHSPWLYCTSLGRIECLDTDMYAALPTADRRTTFLEQIVDEINTSMNLHGKERVPYIVASDFRDEFSTFTWRNNGGSIFHVMKALNHKSFHSTTTYLDNSAINDDSTNKFLTFSNVLIQQIRESGRLDTTIIAKLTQDGPVTADEYNRLTDYRRIRLSRIGIGCKDPFNPPLRVDPNFQSDGIAMCNTHRCTLCVENGVIMPESLEGLAMRMAELQWLKKNMAIDAFIAREYQQEYDNTELALMSAFDTNIVVKAIAAWEVKITAGIHRPVEFQAQLWMKKYNEEEY